MKEKILHYLETLALPILTRRANNEKNPAIAKIYQDEQTELLIIINQLKTGQLDLEGRTKK